MELSAFINLIKIKKQTIVSVMLLFLILAIIFTAVQPFEYGSESKLLIVQNFPISADPYIISKSNEFLSAILAEIVVSNSFFHEVMNSGFNIEKNYFAGNTKKQMKKWQRTARAKAINDTGIISVNVFHKDKYQTEQIARAIGYALKTKHSLYHGGGDNVIVKTIDRPIISNWQVKPNIILNLALGIISGLIIGLCYIYLFPEKKYNIRIIPRLKKKIDSAYNFLNVQKVKDKLRADSKNDNYYKKSPNIVAGEDIVEIKEQDSSDASLTGNQKNNAIQESDKEYESAYEDITKKGNIKNIFG